MMNIIKRIAVAEKLLVILKIINLKFNIDLYMYLSKLLIITLVIISINSYSQKPIFSKNGTQKISSSKIDTIIKTGFTFKITNGKNIIFKHLDNASDAISVEDQSFTLSQLNITIDTTQFDYFFLLNIGIDSIEFCLQDGDLMTIKESLNDRNLWKPTQFWIFSDCGNSYYPYYVLHNGQLAIIKTLKSNGSYYTKQRLRFKTYPNKILISDPYYSRVDINDFFINDSDWFHKNMIRYTPEYFSYLSK